MAEVTTRNTVTLTVRRPGQSQPLVFTPWFRAKQGAGDTKTLARSIAAGALDSYPLGFLIVGLAVLFLRLQDRNAWLLALVFATFITAAPMPNEFAMAPHNLRSFLLAYRTVANSMLPGLFYFFFAVFPTRSPIDRKVPWLKWVLPVIGLCLGLEVIGTETPHFALYCCSHAVWVHAEREHDRWLRRPFARRVLAGVECVERF